MLIRWLFLRVISQGLELLIFLFLLLHLLSGLLVLVAEDGFLERSCLYVIVIEVDGLSM